MSSDPSTSEQPNPVPTQRRQAPSQTRFLNTDLLSSRSPNRRAFANNTDDSDFEDDVRRDPAPNNRRLTVAAKSKRPEAAKQQDTLEQQEAMRWKLSQWSSLSNLNQPQFIPVQAHVGQQYQLLPVQYQHLPQQLQLQQQQQHHQQQQQQPQQPYSNASSVPVGMVPNPHYTPPGYLPAIIPGVSQPIPVINDPLTLRNAMLIIKADMDTQVEIGRHAQHNFEKLASYGRTLQDLYRDMLTTAQEKQQSSTAPTTTTTTTGTKNSDKKQRKPKRQTSPSQSNRNTDYFANNYGDFFPPASYGQNDNTTFAAKPVTRSTSKRLSEKEVQQKFGHDSLFQRIAQARSQQLIDREQDQLEQQDGEASNTPDATQSPPSDSAPPALLPTLVSTEVVTPSATEATIAAV